MNQGKNIFLRYPGGKGRMLNFLVPRLISTTDSTYRLVEPFAGGCAVFFGLNPKRALLSDINSELIDLYRGIRRYPIEVWKMFRSFPSTKDAYYKVRDWNQENLDLPTRAARTLYLNRTCFKGMWRHNAEGEFNVGYGGQQRRWVINEETLLSASRRLKNASIKCNDFEEVIDACRQDDFIFVDPPYCPGERDMVHDHFRYGKFTLNDHKRLAMTLRKASARRIRWALTTSGHPDIVSLFHGYDILAIPRGTGRRIGTLTNDSCEVLIRNYKEVSQ